MKPLVMICSLKCFDGIHMKTSWNLKGWLVEKTEDTFFKKCLSAVFSSPS